MLARDGDDVGQAAAAKEFPLGIRDPSLFPEGEGCQQGGLRHPLPGATRRRQPAIAHTRGHGIQGDDPAQVAGGGDPLAKEQAPPIHPRFVGQAMGRLERGHQGDAAAGRQRRQHLIGIDPHQGWHDEGAIVQGVEAQQQARKFIPLFLSRRLRTLHVCGYDVARFFAKLIQPGKPVVQIHLHPEDAEQQKQQPPATTTGEGEREQQHQATPFP